MGIAMRKESGGKIAERVGIPTPVIQPPRPTLAGQLLHKRREDRLKLFKGVAKAIDVVKKAPKEEQKLALEKLKPTARAMVKEYHKKAPVRKAEIRLYGAGARELKARGQDAEGILQNVVVNNLKEAMGTIYKDSPVRELHHVIREETIERETREKYELKFPDLGLSLPKFPDIPGALGNIGKAIVTAIVIIGVVIVVIVVGGKILSKREL